MKSSMIYQPQFGVVALCCIIPIVGYIIPEVKQKDNAVYNRSAIGMNEVRTAWYWL